ncbi:Rieske 2Fe-2S domain-containing protein [Amycolatopsis sp. H20-H5]|uniref:Rieske 2Fe-2S domain-containing protein n=1 Tax=Amycolatopsis sp. H20-H5 TaxID=3046309 RepID=UPI002DB999C6|nr:Rieske 2Fe-2S domain-containing protein [Amycolatopsis sp. H20-H5]MEC3974457.1 Rieske 2Fe-2S domain-containing protein [Amycolatopsis sp. H20-H5]
MTSQSYPSDDFSIVENDAIAGQYLATFWQPVALSKDYAPGTSKRIKLLGKFYTLYRGDEGAINLVQDRCPHRGTSLAYGWVEGNCIRCRYHGWKFSGDGQGVEFPAETATYARSISLETHPVREYLGVVFGYLGEGEPPEFPRYPELEDESAGELVSMAVTLPYNYFQRVENDVDEVHIYYVHRDLMANFGLIELPRITAKETDYGLLATTARPDGSKFFTHFHMPNLMLREAAIGQDKENLAIHAAWRLPIDNVTTLSVMIDRIKNYDESIRESEKEMVDPAEIAARVLAGELTLDEVDQNHPLLPVIQDTVAMAAQGLSLTVPPSIWANPTEPSVSSDGSGRANSKLCRMASRAKTGAAPMRKNWSCTSRAMTRRPTARRALTMSRRPMWLPPPMPA